ncbi:phasin family protein [Acinetobacter baumannii]|uniref:phasin family protein n=1 Tax=Acinetobacter baumannii TaxID=470 RepID=UPI003C749A30
MQNEFARTSFDAFMAHASRSTESALKLAGEVAQPVSNRMALAVEKVKAAA